MIDRVYELSANLSLLFTEHPLLRRFEAARAAGFGAVEAWWPFAEATPSTAEVNDLVDALTESSLRLTGLNFFAGDMAAGMRGIASLPERQTEFRDNVAVIVDIAERTGCRHFNALYGAREPGVSPEQHAETALGNLVFATEALADVGGTVLIEPLSGVDDFPVLTASDAIAVVDAVTAESQGGQIALLYDTFHLTNNGDDLAEVARAYGSKIGHVQVADAPGRGQPGTGTIDFSRTFSELSTAGYEGFIACEYAPTVPTTESLGWIARFPQVRLPEAG